LTNSSRVASKALIAAFYGNGPKFSFWNGCSQGGRQGLREAQQYPADYDGIIAGAPAAKQPNHYAGSLWVASATLKDPASFIPPEKYSLINRAVLAACDAKDGVADGVLEDPRRCDFDPQSLACSNADGPSCLTPKQVNAVRQIYAPAKNPRSGEEIWPGLMQGSELGWAAQAGGPGPIRLATDFFKYLVFENPNWDWRTFDFDRDVATAIAKVGSIVTTMNPDLEAFRARGGKLILYHGWNDQAIAPENTVKYYESVVDRFGKEAADQFVRLFIGTRCGTLPRRARAGHVRCGGDSGGVGRERYCPNQHHRVAASQRQGRANAASLPIPSGGRLQGLGQHG
jgi:feruloyl esterase